jgi:hypothetical protein
VTIYPPPHQLLVDTRHALQALIEEIPAVTDPEGAEALWTLLLVGPLGAVKAEQRVEELASAFERQWLDGMSDAFTNLAEQTALDVLAAVESAQQQILRGFGELPASPLTDPIGRGWPMDPAPSEVGAGGGGPWFEGSGDRPTGEVATLHIGRTSSRCGACGKNADPTEAAHVMETMVGPGCGAVFVAVAASYSGSEDDVQAMRPDLPLEVAS